MTVFYEINKILKKFSENGILEKIFPYFNITINNINIEYLI